MERDANEEDGVGMPDASDFLRSEMEAEGPGTIAMSLMFQAGDLHARKCGGDADVTAFISGFFGSSIRGENGRDPDALIEAFLTPADEPINTSDRNFVEEGLRIVVARIYEIMDALSDGDRDRAWAAAAAGNLWYGLLAGLTIRDGGMTWEAIRERMMSARHRENNAIRDQAYAWLADNFDREKLTVDDAAERLASIVPVKLSTRLTYVKSWKKTRQSPQT